MDFWLHFENGIRNSLDGVNTSLVSGCSGVVIQLILYDQLIRLWRYTIKNMLSINVARD